MRQASTSADGRLSATQLRSGARAMLPVLVGVAPFALVAGLAGSQNGLSVLQTAAFSLFAYAGAAQIAALELIGNDAAAGVVVATALIINLRFVIYSATMAPHFAGASLGRRAAGAYLLVDHAVALGLPRFNDMPRRTDRISFYFGACLTFWLTWQLCSFIGSLLGTIPSLGILAFAMPLSFLGLLAPHLKERPKILAAATAGVIALVGVQLPANLGMILGTLIGIGVGAVTGWRKLSEGKSA